MSASRLSLAVSSGDFPLPAGEILVFGATAAHDLSALPTDRVVVEQPFFPDHQALVARGLRVAVQIDQPGAMAVVFVPRAKALARALLARAAELVPDGLIVVDGQKTDGTDSLWKELRKRTEVLGTVTKAHGRLFWFQSLPLANWRAEPGQVDGFVTAPGVFSADGVDPASSLLAANLPAQMKGTLADFGAGWGYLTAQALRHDSIIKAYMIEADHRALDCARQNVADPRAQFLWADATGLTLPEKVDWVVMNPPFHTDRKADPELGQRFINAAAANLKPSGQLLLVANRHLPYENSLSARFAIVRELPGSPGFKLFHASKPRR